MLNIQKINLPSNGLLGYPREITIRGLKVREVAQIYASSSDASINHVLKEIIEEKDVFDLDIMCDEDKWYILHQARVLTMGTTINLKLKSPHDSTGAIFDYTLDYNDFNLNYLDEDELNREVSVQDLDNKWHTIEKQPLNTLIRDEIDAYRRKFNPPQTEALIWNQAAKIKKLDGKKRTIKELVEFILDLPASQLNHLITSLNLNFGLDTTYTVECPTTHLAFTGGLAFTADLF